MTPRLVDVVTGGGNDVHGRLQAYDDSQIVDATEHATGRKLTASTVMDVEKPRKTWDPGPPRCKALRFGRPQINL